ncbi:MAG: hypothetical protein GX604_10875 [Actinobacteria bacterium]|nr:hypothetical protein [Actinomycetota bacterium]
MSEQNPKKLILEYEDGSCKVVEFANLPGLLQRDLLRQPFAGGATPSLEGENSFVVLEWEDGWKEVFEIDVAYTDVMKYYVITRPEDVGRLSLGRADGYPELIELTRRPLGVKRIAFKREYAVEEGVNRREGKKLEQEYELTAGEEAYGPEMAAFLEAVAAVETTPQALLAMDEVEMIANLDSIRKDMGIVAGRRQRDVLNFMVFLAKKAAKTTG